MATLKTILTTGLKALEYFFTFIGLIFRVISEGFYYLVGLIRKVNV